MILDQRYVCMVEGVLEQVVFEDIHLSHACDQPHISEYFPDVKKALYFNNWMSVLCMCVSDTYVRAYIHTDS